LSERVISIQPSSIKTLDNIPMAECYPNCVINIILISLIPTLYLSNIISSQGLLRHIPSGRSTSLSIIEEYPLYSHYITHLFKIIIANYLGCGPVVKVWNQEVCSLCGLRFKPCSCSYDGHWRLTWSLTSGPVGLVEVWASWPGHPR
jgi:hypothetical protein